MSSLATSCRAFGTVAYEIPSSCIPKMAASLTSFRLTPRARVHAGETRTLFEELRDEQVFMAR